jgi:hypothetical protein
MHNRLNSRTSFSSKAQNVTIDLQIDKNAGAPIFKNQELF